MESPLDADADGSLGEAGSRLWPRVVAWTLFAFVLGASAWGVAGSVGDDRATRLGENLMWSVILVAFAFVGAFIVQQRPDHRIGWLLFVPGLAAVVDPVAQGVPAAPPDEVTAGVLLALWVENFSWLPVFFSTFLVLALFPSGRPINHRWRWHTWLTVGMGVLLLGWGAFARELGPLDADWTVNNPVGFLPTPTDTAWFMPLWNVGLVTISVGALVAMVVRYRRADPVERQQLKWLLYAVTVFSLVYVAFVFLHDRWTLLGGLLLGMALLFIPLAIMIAIVRYRLFDIDVIIRRTVVYGLVSGLLAAIYVGAVVAFRTLLGNLAGVDSSLGVAASTLLVVVLFGPVRRRVQTLVARRFFRTNYNAQLVVATFGYRARQLTDVTQLTDELVGVVDDALHPRSVGVWLPPPGRPEPAR